LIHFERVALQFFTLYTVCYNMDQHPIPQNVTGFQFKLIGSMTVKQFGYVALGVIAAVITYYFPLKGLLFIFLKALLIPLFGSSGAIVAFVPIDGRPLDVMVSNFIQALFAPNQYIYRKTATKFSFSNISHSQQYPSTQVQTVHETPKQKLINERGRELQKLLIRSSKNKTKSPIDAKEAAFLSTFSSPNPTPASTSQQPHQAPVSQPALTIKKPVLVQPQHIQPIQKTPSPPNPEILKEKEDVQKKQMEFAKREEVIHQAPIITPIPEKTLDLEKQVQEIHSQKQILEQEILRLKNQLLNQKAQGSPIQAVKQDTPSTPQSAHVRSLPKEMNKRMGILVSDTPNVVAGVVKDARGNVLSNILVEIKDKDGNPVRAFKTNALGNFASATPLAVGTYTITLEDLKKQHTFDEIKITADNQIMLPLEITSYDKREELRRDLFN